MKCKPGVECKYCSVYPMRLPPDEEIDFIPDPVFDKATEKYKSFDETYGTVTTDKERPSYCKVRQVVTHLFYCQ